MPSVRNPAGRRLMLGGLGAAGLASMLPAHAARAARTVTLPLAGGPDERPLTPAFPQAGSFPGKGPMILQRTRPALLETPFEVLDQDVFTPNDRFFVRWHRAVIPEEIDAAAFRLTVEWAGEVHKMVGVYKAPVTPEDQAAIIDCLAKTKGRQ